MSLSPSPQSAKILPQPHELMRMMWWNVDGGYFGSIFTVKSMLPKAESKSGELFNNFVSGAVGGAVGTALNTPCEHSLPSPFTCPSVHAHG